MNRLSRLFSLALVITLSGCATQFNGDRVSTPGPQAGTTSTKTLHSPDKKPVTTGRQNGEREIWRLLENNIGFANDVPNELVARQIDRYSKNQRYFDSTLERAELYLPYVLQRVLDEGLPAEIALLPFVESGYNPFAYSPGGAAGLWQFIPSTADSLNLKRNYWYDGRRDIVQSTDAAIDYLKTLNQVFNGDWLLTLAAYNAGPGKVKTAIKRNRKSGKATDFWSIHLNSITRQYVPRLVALTKVIAEPDRFGIELKPIPRESMLEVVQLQKPLDLTQAAKIADISTDNIYRLNPGYLHWVTPPSGSHQLVLPDDSAAEFKENLANLTDRKWQPLHRYHVVKGDTLSRIASRGNISVTELASLNKIALGTPLRIGQMLLVPSGAKAASTPSTSDLAMYEVAKGDSLWKIARSNDLAVEDLVRWNEISRQSVLKPGQVLKLYGTHKRVPHSYRVRSGDSLSVIAKRHKVELKDLLAWNNLSASSPIKPGQTLKVFIN